MEEYFQTKIHLSSVYRSEPVELTEQPWFFNQVARIEPEDKILPTQTLQLLKKIEKKMGRQPGVRYGPRLIDLDLLLFKNWVLESSFLTVPHPKMEERAFVLMPLLELDPNIVNPRTNQKFRDVFEEKKDLLSFCERIP